MKTRQDTDMTTTADAARAAEPTASRTASWVAAFAGLIGAGVALGVSELIAGIVPGGSSLIAAVGQTVIDLQPPGAKDFVVALFGTNDKLALELFVTGAALAFGALLGYLGRDRFAIAAGGFVAFGIVGFLAVLQMPLASPAVGALSAGIGVLAGIQAMSWLMAAGQATTSVSSSTTATMPNWSRRSLLIKGSALGVVALAGGVVGRTFVGRASAPPVEADGQIPPASDVVPPLSTAADLSTQVAGLSPIVVPNGSFYQIDTALLTPIVDSATWQLRIHGMVDRETTLTWEELLEMPLFEQYVTIACVSNEVGGNLVGNAKWTGVRLREVLDLAGVQSEATQLVGRSVDGWTAGMPTAWVMDPAREPMIAVRMNDEPLPPKHGFPARLIVPGLYGYVSATKWLAELELTTLEAFDAYWVPLGWAKEAPILTQSRIDTPRPGSVAAGRVAIAGVAWAPDRGVQGVEVAIDGEWRPARLSAPISDATWVQWVYEWETTPGRHRIEVRATDGSGQVQTDQRTPPAPDGARGWHSVDVTVG
jgi:DMSO/TMAO reductase YedYZ molybdopterin-dependent catalytic subunit